MEIDYKNYKLTPMPARIRSLPVCPTRGVPVPWFVPLVDGKPEFRATQTSKVIIAIREQRCWVCGDKLGKFKTFVIGPMCGINRISAEPPSHLECAEWSVKNCPFLSKPHMHRREDEFTKARMNDGPGIMIRRNPCASCLWTVTSYHILQDGDRGFLFKLSDPVSVSWWKEGRTATRDEVMESVRTGLPLLQGLETSQDALDDLKRLTDKFEQYLPAEASHAASV